MREQAENNFRSLYQEQPPERRDLLGPASRAKGYQFGGAVGMAGQGPKSRQQASQDDATKIRTRQKYEALPEGDVRRGKRR